MVCVLGSDNVSMRDWWLEKTIISREFWDYIKINGPQASISTECVNEYKFHFESFNGT